MGWIDATLARTRARVSKSEAEIAELNNDLLLAKARFTLVSTVDGLAHRIIELPGLRREPISDWTAVLAGQLATQVAVAQAEIDDVEADLAAERARLSLAQKADRAVKKVATE